MRSISEKARQAVWPVLACLLAQAAGADTAPIVSANSGFQAGPHHQVEGRLDALGLDSLRDGVVWGRIESQPGIYDFDRPNQRGIAALIAAGRAGSITIYPRNPIYESGNTLMGEEGIAAFARFASQLKMRFPQIDTIQVGNEFNSTSFQTGPAREMAPLERARLHARHLAALASRPELEGVRILGGSTHSIAAGYVWEVLDAGGAAHMDAVAVHPYTTPPEHIPGELAVLRRHPDMTGLEIEATEFGTTDIDAAPDLFWRHYCMMAMAGVRRAVWYSLETRGDGYAAVLEEDFGLTPVGRALMLAHEEAQGREVEPFRPDPYTYGCRFGRELAVLWGERREVQMLDDDIELLTGALEPIEGPPVLDPERVLVLRAPGGGVDPYADLVLGPHDLRADSYHEFARPVAGGRAVDRDTAGFDRYVIRDGRMYDLSTCPGQQAPGTPWRPYLCNADLPRFVLKPEDFTLGGPVSLVHRYNPAEAGALMVEVEIGMHRISRSGVGVALQVEGHPHERRVVEQGAERLVFGPFDARPGAPVHIVIDPNGDPGGDIGTLRIRVRDAGPAISPMGPELAPT